MTRRAERRVRRARMHDAENAGVCVYMSSPEKPSASSSIAGSDWVVSGSPRSYCLKLEEFGSPRCSTRAQSMTSTGGRVWILGEYLSQLRNASSVIVVKSSLLVPGRPVRNFARAIMGGLWSFHWRRVLKMKGTRRIESSKWHCA